MTTRATRRPVHAALSSAVLGIALILGGCRGGDEPRAVSTATAVGASGGTAARATATVQTRAIGKPQGGAIPVWLTSYAVLPWVNRVDPGRHTLTVSNRSTERHSFAVIRFDGDPRSLPRSSNKIAIKEVTVVVETDVIDPGRELDLQVNLEAGRYVLTSTFSEDYVDGMAAAFNVGGSNPGPVPVLPAEGELGVYLTEFGGFISNPEVGSGKTTINVHNLGSKARDFAVIRWRGKEDALPTDDGLILLDGLQEVYRFDLLLAGEARPVEVELRSGFSYVLVSLVKGEYEGGIHAQVKVN